MRRLLPVVLALLLAGCAAPAAVVEPAAATDWDAVGAALFVEHDHTDRAQHEDVAHGLAVAAFGTLADDGVSLGEYTEIDHQNGLIAVSIALTEGAQFVLLDAAALPQLVVLSRTWEAGAYGDVKLDKELPLLYHAHPGDIWGFTIWDVSDPRAPVRVGVAHGAGCHMLHPQRIGGASYVWCVGLPTTSAYRIVEGPAGVEAVPVSFAAPQSDPELARYASYYEELTPLGPAVLLASHDMTAQDDSLTGAPVLAVANELQGIRIYDVSVPELPREIGAWRGEGLNAPMDRVHTVVLHAIGDRRIAFAATETFSEAPASFYFVDFTDLRAPTLLARWTPPGIPHDDGIRFSAHNLNLAGERAYLANFHGGVWVLDVSDPAAPQVVAHRMSARDTSYPEAGKILLDDVALDENAFWDVVVVNGYTLASDMPAGIEVLAVDGDPHGDAAYRSVA